MTISAEVPDVSNFITKNVDNLTYYTLKTNTGSLIDLEINQSTYVVTLSLKDQDGNVISTDEIDLPLENVVVSGSYDETNQKIVLTLQNGNTVDIPVGDLIAGLQSEITSQNKLASDLVDDSNSGHKFTSTSEKQTWNSKYDKPNGGIPKTDLSSNVQTSLGKADTAIQSSDLVDYATKTEVQEVSTKIVGSGESLLINNTEQAILNLDLKGNTSQEGTPTPESPQDIHVVSGDNTIDICGKNLLKIVDRTYSSSGITAIASNGEITLNGTATNNAFISFIIDLKKNDIVSYSANNNETNSNVALRFLRNSTSGTYGAASLDVINKVNENITLNQDYDRFQIRVASGTTLSNFKLKPMIVKGTTVGTYEQYIGKSYPINLGDIELCKIGTYQDKIVKDNGKWYLNKQIGKVILDGSENWQVSSSRTTDIYRLYINDIKNLVLKPATNSTLAQIISSHYQIKTAGEGYRLSVGMSIDNTGILFIYDSNYNTSTSANDFKTWLSTHNTTVYYVLATPTETEITDTTLIEQLEAFKTAQSYNGETNINQTNAEKPFILDYKTFKNVPLMTSQIINDSNYVTNSDIPTKTSDLTNDSNFVTNTDYANGGNAGIIKTGNGANLNSGHNLQAPEKTYTEYQQSGTNTFIGKGTLENVITGKNLINSTSLQNLSIDTNSPTPNFDNMTPIASYEFDVADTNYHPIYTLPNTGLSFTNFRATVGYRITVTGSGIEQIVDIIDEWYNPASYPLTTAINRTLSTSAATTGFRYLRAVYPTSTYINDTNYPLGQEIACYNSTARHFVVDVFRQPSDITWKSTADTSIYVNSTYNGNSAATIYSTRGWIYRSPASFVASSASSATYASGYEPATVGVGSLKTGAAAISAAHIAYLADDNLVYDISNTTKNMAPGFTKIGLITTAVAKNTAISQTYFRSATPLSSTNLGTISHDTLALGKRMFLRCTMDANRNIHSDNYIATTMGAGYTWMPIGVATSSSAGYMDTRSQHFYTLDANGKLTHIDGLEIAANS